MWWSPRLAGEGNAAFAAEYDQTIISPIQDQRKTTQKFAIADTALENSSGQSENIFVANMGRFKGKKAVIIGGTSAIGLATTKRFVVEGSSVFITGRLVRIVET